MQLNIISLYQSTLIHLILSIKIYGQNECGILEDPYAAPPEDAFDLTNALEETPDAADEIILTFDKGIRQIDGKTYQLDDLILTLNALAGKHRIGRIDHVENRLVGIKSRRNL